MFLILFKNILCPQQMFPSLRSPRNIMSNNVFHHKYSCSSAISTLAGKENKRRLQTLSIDNAWSNKNFLVYLTFRMLQHTSSEVNGYNCYKHFKIQKIKRGTGDKIKITMTKLILPMVDTTGRN